MEKIIAFSTLNPYHSFLYHDLKSLFDCQHTEVQRAKKWEMTQQKSNCMSHFFFNFRYIPYIILMAVDLKLMNSSKSICSSYVSRFTSVFTAAALQNLTKVSLKQVLNELKSTGII